LSKKLKKFTFEAEKTIILFNMNGERIIVAKFGGTSMGGADSVSRVQGIINSDRDRRIIVVSAPGRTLQDNVKVTDSLLGGDFASVERRFLSMGQELGWKSRHFAVKQAQRKFDSPNPDERIAVGEWLSARMLADLLGAEFVDASEVIKIRERNLIEPASYDLMRARFRGPGRFVVPGFYGDRNGRVATFERGGSDTSGSYLAAGVEAETYENWTDIDGLRTADPRLVENPTVIPVITYREMRELAQRGTEVLQADSITPVVEAGIPINIRNTFNSDNPGTIVQRSRESEGRERVLGITGRPGMMAFRVEQYGMNDYSGRGAEILGVFAGHDISYEQDPSGRDNVTVLVSQNDVNGNEEGLLRDLRRVLPDANVSTLRNLALLSVVGQNIGPNATEVLGTTFRGLSETGVNVTTVDFTATGNNIVMSVAERDLRTGTEALYRAFIDPNYSSR
jgi:aspartate kinase